MILQSLDALYDRLGEDPSYGVAPPGYSLQKITFKVVLTPEGELHAIEDTRRHSEGRARPRQVLVPGRTKPPGSGINPGFLWDNCGYMLGFDAEGNRAKRTKKTFEAFRAAHLEREDEIRSNEYSAVCRFLENWNPATASEHSSLEEAAATGFGVFQIAGQTHFVHEDPKVSVWWQKQAEAEDEGMEGQCLVTGERRPLARVHDKVRGVVGTQGAGGAIVGFNESAYESYGKTQSYNAPISKETAFRYVTALNALLDGPMRDKHRLLLGDTTVAFWTGRQTVTEDVFADFAVEGSALLDVSAQDEARRFRVERFLRSLREGGRTYADLEEDPEGTPYFLLGLSPNSARISVRFFETARLSDLLDNLRQHHRDIGIEPSSSERRRWEPEFPAVRVLLAQAAREAKEIPPLLAGPLMRAIVAGLPYPDALFSAVLRRIRADRSISYLRCCVIKGYLNRNLDQEVSMSLDMDRPDPAYRLGRLFAALEKTQKDALGEGLNTTIRDAFYSSASATPGSVFPRLLRTYQHHLAKLEGGLRVSRERLVQAILDPLRTFPPHLSLPDQGLFAVGYYHQTSDFYKKKASSS